MREPHLTSHILQEHSSPPSSPAFLSLNIPQPQVEASQQTLATALSLNRRGVPVGVNRNINIFIYIPPPPPPLHLYIYVVMALSPQRRPWYLPIQHWNILPDRVCYVLDTYYSTWHLNKYFIILKTESLSLSSHSHWPRLTQKSRNLHSTENQVKSHHWQGRCQSFF